ncbi:MAG: LSU ribosomal protein L6p (L9e) [Brockia lithotrophica]|uniref:Large ribosomal subunit protein uL6 n=1 Tax=Brockia lithotrophica TaxID=933949 RepID=A0A2T5G4X0_9BACL|nr:50S ribosomal protein L6 [Brockia lithotrophica]MBT9253562.1 50S ribosomal protein L6 [Brockia lithotrophica]PTQ51234.1 MAG: LSU ribosomal protein L6p (L9e) [Brockia lithotrophica]
MSRIGRKPIPIPPGVSVSLEGRRVSVKGPKGTLELEVHPEVEVAVEDGSLVVRRKGDEKFQRAMHGTTRALLANLVEGVTKGFEVRLDIVGVGYRAQKQGKKLVLSLGYSHPVEFDPPEGIEFDVPQPTKIVVRGIDKQKVGLVAANVRAARPPEPYKGKGIRYEGEEVHLKAGKAGKAGGKKK